MLRLAALAIVTTLVALGSSAAQADLLPGAKTARDRAVWRAILHWPSSCESTWTQAGFDAGISLWTTADGRKLVEVTCFLGAYQGSQLLYLISAAGHVGPLRLLTYVDPGNGHLKASHETQIAGAISFDRKSGRLSVYDKFRGVGDCGTYSGFLLAGEGFRPHEVRSKPNCNGKPPYDPLRWPKLAIP